VLKGHTLLNCTTQTALDTPSVINTSRYVIVDSNEFTDLVEIGE
jgi:hypothetical protein